MKDTSDLNLMVERLESLKAGIICALSFAFVFLLGSISNYYFFNEYFKTLKNTSIITPDLGWLISAGIAGFSGFLFGVTYRYIIREDTNPQLKSGSVMAFGLVRGLALVNVGLNFSLPMLGLLILCLESILGFAVAALILDNAIKFGWVKAFMGNG